ncbi:class I SAM-dependent methyltransferase [Aestuariivita boseongensis]|uniref:class I SAM-dependent methyltransferase n=1 Tax=Aestuariivita boseongensis TaxID=1470562 RepID=UPI000682800B|nr:class I SAM-dependent methyltransferase [Aestuariivita boseongensis]
MDNRDQKDFWTDIAGPKWVEQQQAMDALMQPVLDSVIARAGLGTGAHVLDIGCGTGASLLAAGEAVGPEGHVLGADISARLLDLARTRTADHPQIAVMEADAATHAFPLAAFDHLISRFGVMFFERSEAAFQNMARALTPGATLSFAAWGDIPANPFFTHAAQAARDVLGPMPKSDPDLPGPFAFRDPARITGVLDAAGFSNITVDVQDIHLRPAGTLSDLATQMMAIGPAEAALKHFEADEAQHAAVHASLMAVFADFQTDTGLAIPARINFATARVPA